MLRLAGNVVVDANVNIFITSVQAMYFLQWDSWMVTIYDRKLVPAVSKAINIRGMKTSFRSAVQKRDIYHLSIEGLLTLNSLVAN